MIRKALAFLIAASMILIPQVASASVPNDIP
ncbi:MAG: hypothetical protein RL319_297, partial [Actinomycetota bacterium]